MDGKLNALWMVAIVIAAFFGRRLAGLPVWLGRRTRVVKNIRLARVSTVFDCTAEQLWDKISRLASLRFVAAPLLHFEPLVPGELDSERI